MRKTQWNKKQEMAKSDVNVPGDEDMPMHNTSDKEKAEKKFTFKKPPLWNHFTNNLLVFSKFETFSFVFKTSKLKFFDILRT